MSQAKDTFFTSVGCMDGRSGYAVTKYGKEKFGVKYADTITEAGLVGLLAQKKIDQYFLNSLKKKVLISVKKHHSKNVVVSGHEDCAGNPIDEERHKQETLKLSEIIRSFIPQRISVVPVFVRRKNSGWVVEEL